jgi:hypothetical protein
MTIAPADLAVGLVTALQTYTRIYLCCFPLPLGEAGGNHLGGCAHGTPAEV